MKETNYEQLLKLAKSYFDKDFGPIANLSNASALLNEYMDKINWVGFYLNDGKRLLLGPFQGKTACSVIPNYKGVCGHCAESLKSVIVDDVHLFEGHIACDSASESEIVIPIIINNNLYGVLDIDAPIKSRFNLNDQINLEKFIEILKEFL